jgi:hypothetical protein
MILSSNQKLGEFEAIPLPEHIGRVWEEIASRLPQYWQAFVDRELAKRPAVALAAHFNPPQQKTPSTASVVTQAFAAAVQQYEKSAAKYRDFFDPEAMEEFADDPGAFKSHLAKEVPVIAGRGVPSCRSGRRTSEAPGARTYWRYSRTSRTFGRTGQTLSLSLSTPRTTTPPPSASTRSMTMKA